MNVLRISYLLAVLPLVGCSHHAAHQRAEKLAREELVQVLEYEADLKKVANATNAYYEKTLNNLEDDFTMMLRVESQSAYWRLAGDAADSTIESGFVDREFRAFVTEALALQRAQEDRVAAQLNSLGNDMKEFLQKMDVQSKKLKSLQAKLEVLQTSQSTGAILNELKPVFEAIGRARAAGGAAGDAPAASDSDVPGT